MAELGQHAQELEDEELDREGIIRIALTHLLEQGTRSESEGVGCAYKGDSGTCCGAAPFIKDYKSKMEGQDWSSIRHTLHQTHTIGAVQIIHDSYRPSSWIDKFKERFPDVDYNFLKDVDIHPNCRVSPAYLNRVLS